MKALKISVCILCVPWAAFSLYALSTWEPGGPEKNNDTVYQQDLMTPMGVYDVTLKESHELSIYTKEIYMESREKRIMVEGHSEFGWDKIEERDGSNVRRSYLSYYDGETWEGDHSQEEAQKIIRAADSASRDVKR